MVDEEPSAACRTSWLRRQLFHQWKIVLFGQVLSFLLACSGATQATLSFRCSLSAPSFTVGLFYIVLAGNLFSTYRKNRQENERILLDQNDRQLELTSSLEEVTPTDMLRSEERIACVDSPRHDKSPEYSFLAILSLRASPWLYFIMALFDVYANYFTVLAFRYTTITSVTLLDALAVPSAMFFSRLLLKRRYTNLHFFAVAICTIGVSFNVLQDYEDDSNKEDGDNMYPRKVLGDTLAILGGIMFGVNNTLGEMAVRNLGGPSEYLGMLGFFATIICATQTLLLERTQVREFFTGSTKDNTDRCGASTSSLLLLAFVLSNVLSYSGASRFLQISEAAFFNLSLLTGDLWSVTFSIVAQHIVPQPFFFVALVLTVSGVIVYEMAPSPVAENSEDFFKPEESENAYGGDQDQVELQSHTADRELI